MNAGGAWAPFRYRAFAVVWSATLVSNVGSWMYAAAAAWLMTRLTTDPLLVSLVQVASTLPVFLLALPAGVLTDVVDKRRFLLAGEIGSTLVCAVFAVLVWLGWTTPANLIVFVFLVGVGNALTSPAWQAVVPELVPRSALAPAVSANSVGINISRAIGPALAGATIGPLGIAAPFVVNAISDLGVIGALFWWREPRRAESAAPAPRFGNALLTGFRYAAYAPSLRATLARAIAFFFFASAYWALLPLVASERVGGGAQWYGILLGAIGAGAVGGAFVMPALKARIGPGPLVAAASAGTAIALALFGYARSPYIALVASLTAGVCWIAAVATLNVSAQVALPNWVRGRGLAIYITVFFGALTAGSALWGQVASWVGLPEAHYAAALGMLAGIALTWRRQLETGAELDLTPSAHWPPPVLAGADELRDGPVLVTVDYRLKSEDDRKPFLRAMKGLRRERLRDGGYEWGLFEDTAEHGKFIETFYSSSWDEHLRQHERVTKTDEAMQQRIVALLREPPAIKHFVTPSPSTPSK